MVKHEDSIEDCRNRFNEFIYVLHSTEDPISTTHCPRLNGVFADEAKCDVFWSCWGGEASRYMCAPGLAYDEKSRVCIWADQVDRCTPEGKSLSYHYHRNLIII